MNNSFLIKHNIFPIESKISYAHKLMSLGSCFSENIGNKLADLYFNIDINPFGVLFNPISISKSLYTLLENEILSKEDTFQHNSLWSSFSNSTLFSSIHQEECLSNINSRIQKGHTQLLNSDFLLITFGTAWVYELKETKEVVANCHKLPSGEFNRRRLTVDEIVENYSILFQKLHAINSDMQVIFTVSPVRHWKDGSHENNISKGILHIAVDELNRLYDYIHYFPAYEIQIDELRDYRFYAEDMVHPSETAINYIWQKFIEFCIDENAIALMKRIADIKLMENHRPIHPNLPEYEKLIKQLSSKKEQIINEFPFLKGRL
ncbi:GSCFA domain-containing protein [Paludibacter sp.]